MNQILLTDNQKVEKHKQNIDRIENRGFNTNMNTNKTNSNDMKKLIRFFGIVILIFGVVITGVYGFKIFSNSNKKEGVVAKPQLSLEETEDFVKIIAQADIGISKMIYTWNDDEVIEKDMNGRTNHEEQMEIPEGNNVLVVKVIDVNNQEIETTKEFNKVEVKKPIIATAIGEDAKLKITVTDETAIKYLKYKWNDEEFEIVEPENSEDNSMETKIDVRRGKNTLTVVAVNIEDAEETVSEIFNGVNKPIIKVTKRGDYLYMKISHDMGFEKVTMTINGKTYTYDENHYTYDESQKELEYKIKLKTGENKVVIVAVSTEGTEETYKGKCTYNP